MNGGLSISITRRRMAREQRGASYSVVTIKTMLVQDVLYAKEKQMLQMITQSFYTQSFYTQTLLHTDDFTHRPFRTQRLLHRSTFTHRRFYTQTLWHTDPFTHKHFKRRRVYTQTLLHKSNCTDPLTGPTKLAKKPQFWTLEPHFVRKGCRRTNQTRKNHQLLTLVSCQKVAAEGCKNTRTSFRAKELPPKR